MKTSILKQFANDVINAPAAVTGGSGKCGGGTKAKSNKSNKSNKSHKSGSNKSGSNKSGSGKSGSSKGGGNCLPPSPKY